MSSQPDVWHRLRWALLALFIAGVALAVLAIVPFSRREIQSRLDPVAGSEHLVVRWIELGDDHGEVTLTASVELHNPGQEAAHPLGARSDLRLETPEGELISPFLLPGESLPANLATLEPGESWQGTLSWWLDPAQQVTPLTLRWLDESVPLELAYGDLEERELGASSVD